MRVVLGARGALRRGPRGQEREPGAGAGPARTGHRAAGFRARRAGEGAGAVGVVMPGTTPSARRVMVRRRLGRRDRAVAVLTARRHLRRRRRQGAGVDRDREEVLPRTDQHARQRRAAAVKHQLVRPGPIGESFWPSS